MWKIVGGALIVLGALVGFFAGRASRPTAQVLVMPNANSRPTYFTVHHIAAAHEVTKGKGTKIGVLDQFFGTEKHARLYAGAVDFVDDPKGLTEIDEHGYWMSLTAHEIAPEAALYALNTGAGRAITNKEKRKADAMVRAIDWAIEHKLDALTYSGPVFEEPANIENLDRAVDRAIRANVAVAFIHYAHKDNILPGPLFFETERDKVREPDVRILHYDYGSLFLNDYLKVQQNEFRPLPGVMRPYLSISSTSPVTAAFVALMRSVKPGITPAECKRILSATSRRMKYTDFGREWDLDRVVDAGAAVRECLN